MRVQRARSCQIITRMSGGTAQFYAELLRSECVTDRPHLPDKGRGCNHAGRAIIHVNALGAFQTSPRSGPSEPLAPSTTSLRLLGHADMVDGPIAWLSMRS